MDNKPPLATDIDNEVIEQALRSVERNSAHGEADAAAAEPSGAPAEAAATAAVAAGEGVEVVDLDAHKAELERLRAQLREREAQLETSQAMSRETLAKLKDEHDRALRAAADLDNFRKRTLRERDETLKYGQEKLLREILPVLDNLDRALDHAKSPADFDGLVRGIQMTRKLFEDTLAKVGVKSFVSLNAEFDPRLHEAMQVVESDAPANTIVAEYVRGYMLNDRLMRPAMVVVARPREAAAAAGAAAAPVPAEGTEPRAEPSPAEAPPATRAHSEDDSTTGGTNHV